MQTKFDELLDFPCDFTFKVMGLTSPTLQDQIVSVVQQHAPGDYRPQQRPSSKGNYTSISISVVVTSKDHVETLYRELSAIDDVRYVL
ncbi:DUF493 family protein YbeD [Aliidiomarina maris]|uniref:UPF0250 protein B0I24_10735 n=1 Tax=Aliidiomarina maris TaxID=531312 RepID=A0A327WY52_9GAMM|nr:DUF493 family protein YbeD [Aliidiomarina maris]MBA3988050.1 hypothetical protein [Idiomarina sp.]MCL5050036.1 DUF493 family protein YbeD [Bacillota bacterium]RAJ96828.1 hypothetical protein B0I24_10735 [Aliidiomarina maris]RUO24229.1 hypothetical protein CWE07_09095 [Aliidiomarina maris]